MISPGRPVKYKNRSIITFNSEHDLIEKFKQTADREKKAYSDLFSEFMQEYIKIHGDGNPIYTLDKWQDPDFQITPAFFRNVDAWKNHYDKMGKAEYEKTDNQLNTIIYLHNQKLKEFSNGKL